jgi:hypothetical protein
MRRIAVFCVLLGLSACADFHPDLSGLESGTDTIAGDSGETTQGDTMGDETGSDAGSDESTGGTPDMGDTEDGFCGDDLVNNSEECDGDEFNGETCETQGFDFGSLSCDLDCTLNTDMCGLGFCNPQPQEGPLAPCQVPAQGGGFCEGGEACLGEWGQQGMCSAMCSSDIECGVQGYGGCEGHPRCLMDQCVYECTADYQCPNPMGCTFSEILQTSICI